jgi:hypothetical protein
MLMKRCGFCLCLGVVFILTATTCLGADTANAFGRYKVLLTNGVRFQGTHGFLTVDSIIGTSSTGIRTAHAVDSIRFLERCTGSRAGTGMAVGAVVGLLVSAPMAISETTDNSRFPMPKQEFHPEVVMLGTIAGGLLGLVVGGSERTWEGVPLRTTLKLRTESRNAACAIVFALRF